MLKSGRIKALGTMSGTSLDGVDAAVIETDGERIFAFGECAFLPYTAQQQGILRAALGKWPDDDVSAATELVEDAHTSVLAKFTDVDLIGFHGQTLAHDPRGRGTHQIGNGALLADVLGVPVVWDFRTADVQLGGEGAPLAPFYHFALAKWIGARQPLAFVNLGGVGNITWVDPTKDRPEEEGTLLAFDTGPANAPMNDLVSRHFQKPYDKGGVLAAKGRVQEDLVERFLTAPYFYRMPPKSLDRDEFADALQNISRLEPHDAIATTVVCVAASVAKAMDHFPKPPERLLITGGGRKNPALMDAISEATGHTAEPVEAVGLDGDMLEAQAFAFLAVRVARGLPTSCPTTTGVRAAVGGGTFSRPSPS